MSSLDPHVPEKLNNPPEIIRRTTNTLTNTATDNGISKATSRARLQGLTLLPTARIQSRPFSNKYFFKRPRLLQYYSQGVLVDSHGRRELSLASSVLVKREANNTGANASGDGGGRGIGDNRGISDGANEQGEGEGEVGEGGDDQEGGKVQRGKWLGRLICIAVRISA
jgi:hypothetical protein